MRRKGYLILAAITLLLYCDTKQSDVPNSSKIYIYYENGRVKQEATYINEKYHGKINHYYENGVLKDSGYNYNNMPKGLFYYYKEDGSIDKIADYIILENDKSELNEIVHFDKNGDTIRNKGHSFRIKFNEDTVKQNQYFEFSVIVENSIFNDSVSVVLADFEETFLLRDSSSVQEFFGNVGETKCRILANKVGQNIVRGIIFDFKRYPNGEISYRNLYFSQKFYVSPC